jgi:hypothetical protein
VANITKTYDGETLAAPTGTATVDGKTVAGTWAWVTDPATMVDVGVYTATVRFTATTGGATATTTVTVTITQAETTGAPTFTAIQRAGRTLADAALSVGTLTPAEGTLIWVDASGNELPGTTVVAANTAYAWRFTPTNTNYAAATGSVTPYVYTYVPITDDTASDAVDNGTTTGGSTSTGGSNNNGSTTTTSTTTTTDRTTGDRTTATTTTTTDPDGTVTTNVAATTTSRDGTVTQSDTTTTTEPDGTVTVSNETTVTAPDGTVTEISSEKVTDPDGSVSESTVQTVTAPSGAVTETVTDRMTGADGSTTEETTETVTTADGVTTSTETLNVTTSDGTTAKRVTTVDENGTTTTTAEASVSEDAAAAAAESGELVTLPVSVEATDSDETAPVVTVTVPSKAGDVKVEIPVSNVTPGTVAILVKPDGTTEIVKWSAITDDGISMNVNGNVTVKLVDNSKKFDDVGDSWAGDAIAFASSRELFKGTSETQFSPDGEMTRSMLMTVLARLDGVDTNTGSTWDEAGMNWAVQKGISDGKNGDSSITREQLATMLYRYYGQPAVTNSVSGFNDAENVSSWAGDAMNWAVSEGLIQGVGNNTLNPTGTATRAQVATILMRYVGLNLK